MHVLSGEKVINTVCCTVALSLPCSGILILAISMFPVFVVWLNSEAITLLLQQEPCVARSVAGFTYFFW